MKISYKKNKIDVIDFILEIMLNSYLGMLFCMALSGLLMVILYKYINVPSTVYIYTIIHPFFGILSFIAFLLIYFKFLPKIPFLTNRLNFSQYKTAKITNQNRAKINLFQRLFAGFMTFNIILILSLLQTIDGLFWGRRLTSLNDLFNGKYTSFTDLGMWVWSLIYLIQILIIFFYLKYKYESPKQKSLIDKTMEIYNSPEAAKYPESKYGRYITVILLSGFWIFLHQIALILIRVFNQ